MPNNQFLRLSGSLVLIYAVIILLMVASILSFQAWQRSSNFRQHHLQLAVTSVTGAAEELSILFNGLQRSMRLFADEQQTLFEAITAKPDDDALWDQLEQRVHNYFPEYFGLTLTDASGDVLRPDFDNRVGEVCRQDIHTFIEQDYAQQGYIHPNPLGYHFDIMVPRSTMEQSQGVFFLSFNPDILARSLRRMQLPGHELLLLRRDQPGLIEVAALGSRNRLQREFFLGPEELARLSYTLQIEGIRWDLVDLPAADLFRDEAVHNWIYAAIVFAVFAAIGLLMLVQLGRKEQHRIEAEEQALQHQSDLAHVDRLNIMGEMASGLAHELNQPLSAISTYCQAGLRIMETSKEKPEKLVHALEQSSLQAQRAGKIVHRMRRFGSKDKHQRKNIDINKILLNAVEFLEPDLTKQGISRRLELGADLPEVRADSIQIEQVVINLLRNAIDAMVTADTPSPELVISSCRRNDYLEVAVEDNGPGFDESMIDTIFDAFYSTRKDGMGLGLAISRSIIEAHGGHLRAIPHAKAGASFYFTLPLNGA